LTTIFAGSPWGSGIITAPDGSRQISELETEIGKLHGKAFWTNISRVKF
jgi:NAD(P)H dehydrogenase (quinone)